MDGNVIPESAGILSLEDDGLEARNAASLGGMQGIPQRRRELRRDFHSLERMREEE